MALTTQTQIIMKKQFAHIHGYTFFKMYSCVFTVTQVILVTKKAEFCIRSKGDDILVCCAEDRAECEREIVDLLIVPSFTYDRQV